MAETVAQTGSEAPETKVYIVHMEKTDESPEQLESNQLDLLGSVVGSPEAAKDAILYHYKHSMHGFSAKLTSEQVDAISKLPGVIQVSPSQTYQLHGKATGVHGGL